jgi:hypothetical protein
MNEFKSKSSIQVKLITIGGLSTVVLILLSLFVKMKSVGIVFSILVVLFIVVTVFYYYSKSLVKIVVEEKFVILKKSIGFEKIGIAKINDIVKLEYCDIPMTVGSKGFFGYIGATMDNSYSYVKNRSEMVRITTNDKKYLLSCENSDYLVTEIKERIKSRNSPISD